MFKYVMANLNYAFEKLDEKSVTFLFRFFFTIIAILTPKSIKFSNGSEQ